MKNLQELFRKKKLAEIQEEVVSVSQMQGTQNTLKIKQLLCLEYYYFFGLKMSRLTFCFSENMSFLSASVAVLVLTSSPCHRLSPFKRIAPTTVYVSPSNEGTPLGPSANQHCLSGLNTPPPPSRAC